MSERKTLGDEPCQHCGIVGKIHWTDAVGCAEFEARRGAKSDDVRRRDSARCNCDHVGSSNWVCATCGGVLFGKVEVAHD